MCGCVVLASCCCPCLSANGMYDECRASVGRAFAVVDFKMDCNKLRSMHIRHRIHDLYNINKIADVHCNEKCLVIVVNGCRKVPSQWQPHIYSKRFK